MNVSTKFQINSLSMLSGNMQILQQCDRRIDGWMDRQAHSYVPIQLCWQGTKIKGLKEDSGNTSSLAEDESSVTVKSLI